MTKTCSVKNSAKPSKAAQVSRDKPRFEVIKQTHAVEKLKTVTHHDDFINRETRVSGMEADARDSLFDTTPAD